MDSRQVYLAYKSDEVQTVRSGDIIFAKDVIKTFIDLYYINFFYRQCH